MKLTFLSCFLWTLLPVLHVAQQQQEIIHIGYYNNADCLTEDYYSVGVAANTCVQYFDQSLILSCTSTLDELQALVYDSHNCSGNSTLQTISSNVSTCTPDDQGWFSNGYLEMPTSFYKITCSASDSWSKNSNFVVGRYTSALQKKAAVNFLHEVCNVENCESKPVLYAYTSACMSGKDFTGMRYSLSESGKKVVRELYYGINFYCWFSASETTYYDLCSCVECSTFVNLTALPLSANDDDDDDKDHASASIAVVVLSIVFSIIFFICFIACFVGFCIGDPTCGLIVCLPFLLKRSTPPPPPQSMAPMTVTFQGGYYHPASPPPFYPMEAPPPQSIYSTPQIEMTYPQPVQGYEVSQGYPVMTSPPAAVIPGQAMMVVAHTPYGYGNQAPPEVTYSKV